MCFVVFAIHSVAILCTWLCCSSDTAVTTYTPTYCDDNQLVKCSGHMKTHYCEKLYVFVPVTLKILPTHYYGRQDSKQLLEVLTHSPNHLVTTPLTICHNSVWGGVVDNGLRAMDRLHLWLHWCAWFSQCVSLYLQFIRTVPQRCNSMYLALL